MESQLRGSLDGSGSSLSREGGNTRAPGCGADLPCSLRDRDGVIEDDLKLVLGVCVLGVSCNLADVRESNGVKDAAA